MPHITIKCFPRDVTEKQKKILANDICDVIKKHFGSEDDAISVALTMIESNRWETDVYDVEIAPELNNLIKKPGYSM